MSHSVRERVAIERAVARSLGEEASVYGYPLVEMLRMCRLQTHARFDSGWGVQVPIDTLRHSAFPPLDRENAFTHEEHDVLHTTGWIYLAEGPRQFALPAVQAGRVGRTVVALYDAYSEKIVGIEQDVFAQRITLLGPHAAAPESSNMKPVVRCPTSMVWLMARTALQRRAGRSLRDVLEVMQLDGPPGTLNGLRPAAVEMWEGETTDAFDDLVERARSSAKVAPAFYANLCRAFAHAPGRIDERPLMARFRQVGLAPADSLDWQDLPSPVRDGLIDGLEDAAIAVSAAAARLARAREQMLPAVLTQGGRDYAMRAALMRSGAAFRALHRG